MPAGVDSDTLRDVPASVLDGFWVGLRTSVNVARCVAFVAMLVGTTLACDDCHPDRPCCENGRDCHCGSGVNNCDLDCGHDCELGCATGDSCRLSCGHDCELDCTDMPTCDADCGSDCDVRCASLSSCDVRVGDGSSVTCENAAHCEIECEGACTIEARSFGSLDATCLDDDGERSPATQCSGSRWACGGC